jgi:hypothetical protein
MTEKTRDILACGLLIVGLTQMIGDVTGIPLIKALGAATAASPAPKVFSAVRGLETFSTRFFLEWNDDIGAPHVLELTPQLYSKMRGPYKRRNIYGAVLAYGPVLPTEIRDPVIRYALTGNAPLLREIGVDPTGTTAVRVRYEPLPSTPPELPRMLAPTPQQP